MILIRYALISLIIYLIIRSFVRYALGDGPSTRGPKPDDSSKNKSKGVAKDVGEYVDYEEINE